MAFDSLTHTAIQRQSKANRNGARRRHWSDLYAYGLVSLVPDAPNMARRFLVIDARHPGRRYPEMVSQLGQDTFSCGCQQALLGGGTDCDHISCVRSALAKYGPPTEEAPAEDTKEGSYD